MVGRRPELTTRRGFGSPWFLNYFFSVFISWFFILLTRVFLLSSFTQYLLAFRFVALLYFCLLLVWLSMFVRLFCILFFVFCIFCILYFVNFHLDFSCSTPPNKLVLSSRALPRCSVVAGLTRWEDFIENWLIIILTSLQSNCYNASSATFEVSQKRSPPSHSLRTLCTRQGSTSSEFPSNYIGRNFL